MSEEVMRADSLLRENAALRAQLADVTRAGDMEHARMAALIEACEVVAVFVEGYPPESIIAQMFPTFYGIFRVYGKNARAAVAAVRPQADALLAELRLGRAVVAEARRHIAQSGIDADDRELLSAIEDYEAGKAREE